MYKAGGYVSGANLASCAGSTPLNDHQATLCNHKGSRAIGPQKGQRVTSVTKGLCRGPVVA